MAVRWRQSSSSEDHMVRSTAFLLCLVLVPASSAFAQRDRLLVEPSPPAEWGLTFSLQPRWNVEPTGLASLVGAEKEDIEAPDGSSTLAGSTWSIGFARGRVGGFDWGVSFTQMRIRKDSVIDRLGRSFCTPPNCTTSEQRLTFRDVTAIGPEVHFYVPFVTIKDRVQPGMEFGGGIAKFRGQASIVGIESDDDESFTSPSRYVTREGEITEIAEDIFMGDSGWAIIGRIEPSVAVIISPRFKVHAGVGFHYPGITYFTLKTTYFFPRAAP
jgi:hypothetical protein